MKINYYHEIAELPTKEEMVESVKNIKFKVKLTGEYETHRWGKMVDMHVIKSKPTIKHWAEEAFEMLGEDKYEN